MTHQHEVGEIVGMQIEGRIPGWQFCFELLRRLKTRHTAFGTRVKKAASVFVHGLFYDGICPLLWADHSHAHDLVQSVTVIRFSNCGSSDTSWLI